MSTVVNDPPTDPSTSAPLTTTGPPLTTTGPPFITDPARDGNIEAGAFTVASDPSRDRAVLAYKTLIDDKISFAELPFENGFWGDPSEIDVYSDIIPGHKFAMAYDPDPATVEKNERHLFFTEEDGDGYVYMQSYDPAAGKWLRPERLRGLLDKESGIKAHRFSGFAATFTTIPNTKDHLILLYFINESNELVEYAGKRQKTGLYKWKNTATIAQNMQIRGAISAIQLADTTYVTYRGPMKGVDLQVGTGRKPITNNKSEDAGEASWEKFTLRDRNQVAKESPLALAINRAPPPKPPLIGPVITPGLVLFHLQKQGRTSTIFALEFSSGNPGGPKTLLAVGKLEPDSNLGAASLPFTPVNRYGVRLLSVSKLDGDDVVLERVQRRVGGTGTASAPRWVISGGVVDTDVDNITVVRSTDQVTEEDW